MLNKQIILEQSEKYDSFYLYDESSILQNTTTLLNDFKDVSFLYSIKTNSHPLVVNTILNQGYGADAASLGEVLLARRNGLNRDKIYYSAPGKSKNDLLEAMEICIIIADSIGEIMRIQELASQKGIVARIGIRINPDFNFDTQTGAPSKFGIDEKILFDFAKQLKGLKNIEIIGIHVHVRSQELKAEVLSNYYAQIFSLAGKVQEKLDINLKFINLGSGIGIPYTPEDLPLDTAALGRSALNLIQQFKMDYPEVKIIIETGRYVVGKSGIYVTKVLDKKTSYGKTFVILSNTLNGFIRPSLSKLVVRYSQDINPNPCEPLFTCNNAFSFIALNEETDQEVVTLVGNLCTSADVIAEDIKMPKLDYGDVVVITNAGSYAAVLSPFQFASLNPPEQLFLTRNNEVLNI